MVLNRVAFGWGQGRDVWSLTAQILLMTLPQVVSVRQITDPTHIALVVFGLMLYAGGGLFVTRFMLVLIVVMVMVMVMVGFAFERRTARDGLTLDEEFFGGVKAGSYVGLGSQATSEQQRGQCQDGESFARADL